MLLVGSKGFHRLRAGLEKQVVEPSLLAKANALKAEGTVKTAWKCLTSTMLQSLPSIHAPS